MNVNGASDRVFSSPPLADIQYGARSHIGRRSENQDEIRLPAAAEKQSDKGFLFAVADGMGGHQGAGVAGRMACKGLSEYHARLLRKKDRRNAPVLQRHLTETILRIARLIRLEGRKDPQLEDMGTTLSCLVLTERHSIVAHVGDSRIYRLRGGHLTRLTTDHTFVQDMVFEGEVAPEEAGSHPLRHLLTRAVGTMEPLERVDARIDLHHPQDRYLLCTDGLYNALSDERLAFLLSADGRALQAAVELVEAALRNGARDNITAVVIYPAIFSRGTGGEERQRS